jgi:HEAT repeat protein
MKLPAENTAVFNQLMDELSRLSGVIIDLAPQLTDPGGNDAQIRYAISGLAMYSSKDPDKRAAVAGDLCKVIPQAKSDEIRDFLFIQLQYVAGAGSVETAVQYLGNNRLADAAARVLVHVGNDASGKALLSALDVASGAQQITIAKALGDMHYLPAMDALTGLLKNNDVKLKKVVLHSLAEIASPVSEKTLLTAAENAGYKYESTDAFGSYVLYLRNSLGSHSDMVAKAAKKMLKTTSETSQIAAKTAALELVVLSLGGKSVDYVVQALASKDRQYREAALKYSVHIQSPKMYEALMKKAKSEKRTEVKAEILTAFGARGDKAAWPFVKECLTDVNSNIRQSAIITAGKLGDANAVPSIIKSMNTDDEKIVETGKNTLLTMNDHKMADDLASVISQTSALSKVAFLEIMAARGAKSQLETIFAQTSSTDTKVRLAAYEALAPVVSEKDFPRIAELLNKATDKKETAVLQKVMYSSIASSSQAQQTQWILAQMDKSPNPSSYYNVLAMVGGQDALKRVMTGFNDNAGTRPAAFEALTAWNDATVLTGLYEIAVKNPAGDYFERAINSYVSKVGASKETPEQKLLLLRKALEIAKTSTTKRSILNQIAHTGTFIGLITAGKYLDDADNSVQQAAVQVVRTISLDHPEYYGTEVTALLNKAMAVNQDPEAGYQKEAIQNHLAALPKDEGFVSMFNGKDLNGWKGLVEDPVKRSKMTSKELAQKQKKADEIMRRDWHVVDGILVFDGPAYDNLCSEKMYGDFEMYVDWKIAAKGDAGIYLRGSPQVQIWDRPEIGSGGLFNNNKNPKDPLVVADNPVNEWNSFYIKMIGEKVTVYLNGILVVDNVVLENYWDRSIPIFPKEAIELQAHGERVEYRDVYVREIPRPEPYEVPAAEKADGFVPLFNGLDMTGWIGNFNDYSARDGMIVCEPAPGSYSNLYTDKEYSDFIIRFEFQLTPAANNGLGIRAALNGAGMELQILDSEADVYANLAAYQYHGSVYGLIPAKRGFLKPVGEWNSQEVVVDGHHIKVTLNGTVILDGNIAEASKNSHPMLSVKRGHIAFLGHDSKLAFRNLRIKDLSK